MLPEAQHERGADERARKQALLRAIIDADAERLCRLVATAQPQLPMDLAISIFQQAFQADVRRGKVGARMRVGGLGSAVFLGLTGAQHEHEGDARGDVDDRDSHADNAITVVCSTAVKCDDPRILDVLLDWEPGFRMGPCAIGPDGKPDLSQLDAASVETTAEFFDNARAPKCAARLRERKQEMVDAVRVGFLQTQAEKRLGRVARRWLGPCRSGRANPPGEDVELSVMRVEVLKAIVARPQIQVEVVADNAFTVGFCLLGRPELVARVGGDALEAEDEMMRLTARALGERSHEDANLAIATNLRVTHHPLLDPLLKPFEGLRSKGVPPYVAVQL